MAESKFDALAYIALEGGGGKGAVYKGAIEALEKLFYIEHKNHNLKYRGKFSEESDSKINSSIFNYSKRDDKVKIKGIAGASTGAINAFALCLGLNSEDINGILEKFPFKNLLKDIDSGKYRMIGKGDSATNPCGILVGEDNFKKLGKGDGVKVYEFEGNKRFRVQGSFAKYLLRKGLISLVVKSVISGAIESLDQFSKMFVKSEKSSGNSDLPQKNVFKQIINFMGFLKNKRFGLAAITGINNIFVFVLTKIFHNKLHNLSIDSIGNLLWDRGMYSGFIVREFLFNCMLYSFKKDTYCKINFVDYFIENGINLEKINSINIDFTKTKDDFRQCDLNKKQLNKLYSITFREFHTITNIDFVVSATNITTSQPMYFSHKWTPDFPVLEAVGMSMNLPPALKAIYNEADVIFQMEGDIPKSVLREKSNVIDLDKYYKVLNKVLTYIKSHFDLDFSLNGNLSFSSYLPYLRKLIIADDEVKEKEKKNTKPENPNVVKPSDKELIFCYNAAFKGLFIDSGVINNIPYNAFRITSDNQMDKILALKLDNNFPEEHMEQLLKALGKEATRSTIRVDDIVALKAGIREEAEYTPQWKAKVDEVFGKINSDYKGLNKPGYKLVKKALLAVKEERSKKFTPWNKQVNAITGVFDALQYGADQGQIRQLSDNNNIICLYCYGIGTYDFNLNELTSLIEFANTQSKKDVLDYFSKTTDN